MDNFSKKNELEILKRKNRRKNLIKELVKYVNISEKSFLDISVNETFCKEVFKKLDKIDKKIRIEGKNYKDNINLSKNYLIKKLDAFESKEVDVKIFFYSEYEIEVICINLNEVITQINKILEISQFLNGYGDFILVGKNLEFGICIERTEYFYEYSDWNNN